MITIMLMSYKHLDENRTRFALLEIGKFVLLEIIIDKSSKDVDVEIKA